MKSSKMSMIMFLVIAVAFSAGLTIAQETNTGGPANLVPGGLMPSDVTVTSPGIVVDLSPDTGSPPATLGGFTMTAVPVPGAPGCTGITPPLPVDGGAIGISPWDGTSRCIGSGWASWSHGYSGDVYYTGGATSQVLTLPSGTKAVYLYVEPNPFSLQDFEAIAQPGGVSTGTFQVDGDGGARYVGFYATGSDTIQSITINGATDFAVGEFGWSGGGISPNSGYKLTLQSLKDDIAQWSWSHGCFDCSGCSCDINGDGEVTPMDALCAFQTYLGICPTECGPCEDICCDVTMDDDCTPQDALEIFKEYLGLPSVCDGVEPDDCTPPIYEPEKWNDHGEVQYNNNCYNYANDEITGTFAQPGRWCGDMYDSLTCSEVRAAAVCDGLVASDKTSQCPDSMHKVYLVVWPGRDYHWYRQDTRGSWSHKPGGTEVRDYDSSGNPIPDPDTADTGSYTERCGYLCACGDNATIR